MKKQSLILATLLALGNVAVNGQETLTPPYTQDFYSSSDFNNMTIIDANNDGYKWSFSEWSFPGSYSNAARLSANTDNGADDWMITPALELKAGYNYTFSFKAAGADNSKNNIDVMIGSTAIVEALTTSVMDKVVLTAKVSNTYTANITVANDGVYYIGFHITAEAAQGFVYVDDIKIEAGILSAAPSAVSSLTATPTVEQAKAVMKLTFTAPNKTNSGADLTEITNIMVYRGTEKIADLGKQTPGESVEYIDNEPIKGYSSYKVICVNTAGEGAEATVNASLSYSKPTAPTNVILTETENGQTITWDAVTTAASTSGVFIPENVTYTITRSDNVVIATNIKECTAIDTYTKDGEGQDLIYYTVTAVNEGGSSAIGTSNKILIGNPYTGEYAESFTNSKYETSTWQLLGATGSLWQTKPSSYYSPAISADQDGTNGFIGFSSYTSGTEQRLVSPIINVSNMQNPRLSFYVYHAATTYTDMVVPELLIDGEYTALNEGITVNGTEGWTKYNFDLTEEQTAKDFQISFKGAADGGYLVAIDNITIKDALAHNLAVTAITAPANFGVGKEAQIVVNVKNTGINTANDYKVVLSCDNEEVASVEGEELSSESNTVITFSFIPTAFQANSELEFNAEVVYTADLNSEDNTASVIVTVADNTLPVPTELSAFESSASTITLNWTAPVVPEVEVQPVMTESFEDWNVDSTEAFANWTFIDGDGKNISGYAGYGSSRPMAFLVSNASSITAKTGSNYIVSPKNSSWRDYRDDWAISPQVVGGQTISFYVCQLGGLGYYSTTFEVCYSTTDNNVESFVVLESKKHKSDSWVEYTFTLPENATYFAIHVIDNGDTTGDALAFDDIRFQPGSIQLIHTGYNIYRDKKVIATINDKATTEYNDTNMADDATEYDYAVSALFETGESLPSNIVNIKKELTDIENITAESAVYASEGAVNIVGMAGNTITIHSVNGQLIVSKIIANDCETLTLNAGIYIVSIADKHLKIVIK